MAISQELLEKLLKNSFPDAQFKVTDLAGDGDHYGLEISDSSFIGKTKIQQHKLVNEALKEYLGGALHALAIKTKLPV